MKKLVLLFASLLMSLTTVTASEFHHDKKRKHAHKAKYNNNTQPIMFIERGIEFLVFPDGSFDFNTNINNDYLFRNHNRRGDVNVTFGSPNRSFRYSQYGKRGVSISHDRDGKVRRIGNVYLNYDRYGKIKRAGNVYMNYNRGNGRLTQVGGLQVNYNRWGEIVRTRGSVNGLNDYCSPCDTYSCDMDHSLRNDDRDHNNNDWQDDNYYYHKQNSKKKKVKRLQ